MQPSDPTQTLDQESETADSLCIGRGSFAAIYVIPILGSPVAYKQIHHGDVDSDALMREYSALEKIYLTCDTDSLFAIPRALAFFNPNTAQLLSSSPSPPSLWRRHERPLVTPAAFRPFTRTTYAMDRVFAVPLDAAQVIREHFYPPAAASIHTGPTLCRLYFGKNFANAPPSRFVNTANFPLDVVRYRLMTEQLPGLQTVEEVAFGMGEMLGRLHWRGGYDARDVEFVLGGDGISGFRYFVIDFNQLRTWQKTTEEVGALVSSFFSNDPYYPRPRPSDPLYVAFKNGYLSAYPTQPDCHRVATTFLHDIEVEQAQRDAAASDTA
ncbi:hypothetical protein BKA93DRAFT_536326 [Sparassis latifolia]